MLNLDSVPVPTVVAMVACAPLGLYVGWRKERLGRWETVIWLCFVLVPLSTLASSTAPITLATFALLGSLIVGCWLVTRPRALG